MTANPTHYSPTLDPLTRRAVCGDADALRFVAWPPAVTCRRCRKVLAKDAARSTSPAPDPKAGEREQVAEAVERLTGTLKDLERAAEASVPAACSDPGALATDLRTVLSALAEARSEVERLTGDVANLRHSISLREQAAARAAETQAHTERLWHAEEGLRRAAEAERDALAAQLVEVTDGAVFLLDRLTDLEAASEWADESHGDFCGHVLPAAARLRQALSMSILRGDKGCSLGAIEAPSCGSPADSQPSGGDREVIARIIWETWVRAKGNETPWADAYLYAHEDAECVHACADAVLHWRGLEA